MYPTMRLIYFRRLTFLAGCALAAFAQAAEPAIIAKARAYLGTEAALNSVTSLHFNGTVTTTDATDSSKLSNAKIEIIAQKPDQQRVVASSAKGVETTAVDGYEGWQRFQDVANPKNQRLVVLKPEAVKRLRAQAWENLSFFRGLEKHGGRIEEQGTASVDGIECQKIAFIHGANIVFLRYFDIATGRLVRTDTDDGGMTREEGERVVAGIRFPTSMKMLIKNSKGEPQLVTIAFESVTVNEKFPDAVFRVPSPGAP
jgi:outer membrane lipoprotein-sorting protein